MLSARYFGAIAFQNTHTHEAVEWAPQFAARKLAKHSEDLKPNFALPAGWKMVESQARLTLLSRVSRARKVDIT